MTWDFQGRIEREERPAGFMLPITDFEDSRESLER